jgi:uncharacterized protein YkwD
MSAAAFLVTCAQKSQSSGPSNLLKLSTVPDDKNHQNRETRGLRMQFGRLLNLSPKLLLVAGIFISGSHTFSLVPACRPEGLANPTVAIDMDAEQNLEREMLALTNQHRIRQGLQELTQDDALVQIAREHSIGMAQQGFISHHLPSGDLKARMNRAGYPHEVARENVASAPTILKAQNALVASSGHERNILAKDVTRIGIGIVRCRPPDDKELYITEVFARPREEFRPAAVREMYGIQVKELTSEKGVLALHTDPVLERLASRSVLTLDYPLRKERLQSLLADSAVELHNEGFWPLSRLGLDVQLLYNPKDLKIPKQVREGQARSFGTAVRQVVDKGNQTAFLVLTLFDYTNN